MNRKALVRCSLEGTAALLAFRTDEGVSHRAWSLYSALDKVLIDKREEYVNLFEHCLPMEMLE